MPHFVYALADPITEIFVYIGITSNPYERLKQHLSCTDTYNVDKNDWITECKKLRLTPNMKILEVVEDEPTARLREIYWINHCKGKGISLFNILNNPKPAIPDRFVSGNHVTTPFVIDEKHRKFTTSEAIDYVEMSRSTFFSRVKELDMLPINFNIHLKRQRCACWSAEQLEKIVNYAQSVRDMSQSAG